MSVQWNMVSDIVSRFGQTSVAADRFFISYNAVAALAFTGFSKTLLEIKTTVERLVPGLAPENAGSKWPKITVGCLNEGITLQEGDVHKLRRACLEHGSFLQALALPDRTLSITGLSCVAFHCRTLERRLMTAAIPLAGQRDPDDAPPPWHLEAVAKTLDQFSEANHAAYWPHLAPDSRTINAYYRAPRVECTLVHDVSLPLALAGAISRFQEALENALPGYYAWFDPGSWHITVRALAGKA